MLNKTNCLNYLLPQQFEQTVAGTHLSIIRILNITRSFSYAYSVWYAAWVYQGPSENHTKRKSGLGRGLGELFKILEFPFNIFATAKASDFKFGMQFGFSKAHHKITRRGKSGPGHGRGELPEILEFPFNIFATAEASYSKFGM